MTADFPTELARRVLAGQAPACIGLDPRLDALPDAVLPAAEPAERIMTFYRETLPALVGLFPAVKPNIAFFERHGAAGFATYEATCRLAHALGFLVVGDVKRGDIGSTAEAYAAIHLDLADAITVHPYMGTEALEPFLLRCRTEGKGLFVLVRTSNPGADELQSLATPHGAVCDVVARNVARAGTGMGDSAGYSPIGAVVGATRPGELARLRSLMPRAWLLLPGIGAQGASVADARAAFDQDGLGALVSQSRGVMQAFAVGDRQWLPKIAAAAATFANESRRVAGLSARNAS